jgi:hypothetical protein
VQTEDKGLQTPFILSLVYVGGAILAAKRSPYDDLIAGGFDEKILVNRVQRQHKLICAAVYAGRIEDLKRMSDRDAATAPAPEAAVDSGVELTAETVTEAVVETSPETTAQAESADLFVEDNPEDVGLVVRVLDETDFRGGQNVTLRLRVTRQGESGREPAADTRVAVKILGTTFSPQAIAATTDSQGIATAELALPHFTSGRAAILIKVEDRGEIAELRRIILPSQH